MLVSTMRLCCPLEVRPSVLRSTVSPPTTTEHRVTLQPRLQPQEEEEVEAHLQAARQLQPRLRERGSPLDPAASSHHLSLLQLPLLLPRESGPRRGSDTR